MTRTASAGFASGTQPRLQCYSSTLSSKHPAILHTVFSASWTSGKTFAVTREERSNKWLFSSLFGLEKPQPAGKLFAKVTVSSSFSKPFSVSSHPRITLESITFNVTFVFIIQRRKTEVKPFYIHTVLLFYIRWQGC